jgi:muconate cycloisomerase
VGKDAGKPVYELLGGPVRSREIRCRFSMGAYPSERVRRTVPPLIERGFTTIKVKVGTNLAEDVERVRLVREIIGPERHIVIDANCGYDAATAIEAARRMEPSRVGLFEQPTPRNDYEGLAAVRSSVPMPVMADDIAFDFNHAVECLRHNACDVISVYPGKNGGIRKARRIAELAAQHGVACSIGSNLEWDVATAAMCHLVVGTPNLEIERYPGDVLGPEYHEFPIVKVPLRIDGPVITAPDGPGLGVEVDWRVVEENRI